MVGKIVSHKGPEPTREKIDLLSSAKYAILAKDRKKIRLDGKIPSPFELLVAGNHEIEIVGENQRVELKYYPAVANLPPPPQNKINLFPTYSD